MKPNACTAPKPPPDPPKPHPKGFTCPRHKVKLHVRHRRPAAPSVVVRYLACPCPKCKYVVRTEERPHRRA